MNTHILKKDLYFLYSVSTGISFDKQKQFKYKFYDLYDIIFQDYTFENEEGNIIDYGLEAIVKVQNTDFKLAKNVSENLIEAIMNLVCLLTLSYSDKLTLKSTLLLDPHDNKKTLKFIVILSKIKGLTKDQWLIQNCCIKF